MFNIFRKPKPSLEEQLRVLEECGIDTLPGITIENLLISWDLEQYQKDPFRLAIVALGGEDGLSNDVWHFDAECIEDSGDYVVIAERMRDLARSDLPIEKTVDHVDIENDSAWLEFELDGQRVHWDAAVQDDWVDPAMLSRFAALLEERNTGRRFTYLDLGGQDCVIGCSSPEQMTLLRKRAKLAFKWLM